RPQRALGACQELGPYQERGDYGEPPPGAKRGVENVRGALHVYTSEKDQGACCAAQRMRAISNAGQLQCQAHSMRSCCKGSDIHESIPLGPPGAGGQFLAVGCWKCWEVTFQLPGMQRVTAITYPGYLP